VSAAAASEKPADAKGASAPAAQLCGPLTRFVWQSPSGDAAIAVVQDQASGRPWTVKGPLWGLHVGETVRLWGRVQRDPKWGEQFRVDAAQPALPQGRDGLRKWLCSGRLPGVGAVLAERIIAALGDHALGDGALAKITAEPEFLEGIAGLTRKKRAAVVKAIAELDAGEQSSVYLFGLGLGPGLVRRILARYGPDAGRQVKDRPYDLVRDVVGIGFRTADKLALAGGMAPDAPERLQAAVEFSLQELANQGHTAPPLLRVVADAARWAEVSDALVEAEVDRAVLRGQVVRAVSRDSDGLGQRSLALAELAKAEAEIAAFVAARAIFRLPPEKDADAALERAQEALGLPLLGNQREAVQLALHAPLAVVTGGPGTGKTTILRGLLAALGASTRVALAAPTGRAARRLAEGTQAEALTLHRLLEYDVRQRRFTRDHNRPLDADVVVIDEVSMVDVPLGAALCRALRPDTRLVLVGDADQLPSVGPGAVLADLLRGDQLPRVRLQRVYRQGQTSHITAAAHQILAGELPESAPRGQGDFFFLPRNTAEEIAATLCEVVTERLPRLGFDPLADVQVLAPMHRGPLGTEALNERLRALVNRDGLPALAGWRCGDKLIQMKNDYDLEVFNGDIGVVEGVTAVLAATQTPEDGQAQLPLASPALRVRFGERVVEYLPEKAEALMQAYAVTVHKAQGSEYPAVVLPLHLGHRTMLQRNLLYTAVTRARRFAVLIGQPEALALAVANDAPIHRFTQLASMVAAGLVAAGQAGSGLAGSGLVGSGLAGSGLASCTAGEAS
jgi:exodeoxyribonuclease V alpha subunit